MWMCEREKESILKIIENNNTLYEKIKGVDIENKK
jgi:hypothetical protein